MAIKAENHRRSKRWLVVIIILFLVIAAPSTYLLWLFSSHIYDPAGASNPTDVLYYTSVPTPPEAQNIRFAAFWHQQSHLTFIRFSAPVSVCLKYATAVIPGTQLEPLTWDQEYQDLGTIKGASHLFKDLSWFDLPYARDYWYSDAGGLIFRYPPTERMPKISNVIGANANTPKEGYLTSSVRVDVSRGVFYFLQQN